jgi:mannose-6-phosphate isomerase
MTELYPLFGKPVLKDYIWGGRNLTDLGRGLPAGKKVAESWEIAAHPDGMSTVENGIYTGQTLQALTEQFGEGLVGTRGEWALSRGRFPLLVKLLDANQSLSVQVHPDDNYAQMYAGGDLGKAEMWVVLRAEPNAAIIYGLSKNATPEQLQQAIQTGKLEKYLNRLPIKVGDHVCIPAGTVHALLGGAVVAEIQQNSNTTYRVYDWNRMGGDGKPRELQIDDALRVISYDQVGLRLPQPRLVEKTENWTREELCNNRYFTVERVKMQAGASLPGNCDGKTLEIWGVIKGRANVAGNPLDAVKFVLLPARLGAFSVETPEDGVLLRAYLS